MALKSQNRAGGKQFKSLLLRQRITVILIQQNDGYFIPKIGVLRTFERRNRQAARIVFFKSLKDK